MAERNVIYREKGTVYQADTCQPLVSAAQDGQVLLEAISRASYPGRRLNATDLPGLSSVGFWDAVGRQSWGLDWHRNEGIELTFLESGTLPWAVKDQEYMLQPNGMTITRPWQPHRVGLPNIQASRLHWIIVDMGVRRPNQTWRWPKWLVLTASDMQELTTLLRHNEQPVWRATPEIRRCFREIGRTLAIEEGKSKISRLAVYLNEVFLLVLEMLRSHDIELDPMLSSTSRMVQLFLKDLYQNVEMLAHTWTSRSMAEHCGLGVTQFVHYCRQLTNMPPIQYLNQCRIEMASKMLIEQPQMNITEIAMACGFSSSQYFATVFKRHWDCSPKARRKVDRVL